MRYELKIFITETNECGTTAASIGISFLLPTLTTPWEVSQTRSEEPSSPAETPKPPDDTSKVDTYIGWRNILSLSETERERR